LYKERWLNKHTTLALQLEHAIDKIKDEQQLEKAKALAKDHLDVVFLIINRPRLDRLKVQLAAHRIHYGVAVFEGICTKIREQKQMASPPPTPKFTRRV
jgi:hypothetical protein